MATPAQPAVDGPKSFAKLNALRDIEIAAQKRWESEKAFEVNSLPQKAPKFMATFPFPYMNGRLHLGHSFSLSKVEFSVAYEKLKGKRALFPFGFHCTGMPIKACADKLKKEVELFGKEFERYVEEEEAEEAAPPPADKKDAKENVDPTKIVKKHGKANAKNTGLKYQFQIMRSMGVPNEEIHLFANPTHWLYYFPPKAIDDLKQLGLHVDWRRSFITTDVNPYFDSFVRWQFNTLRKHPQPKIKFGERYTIYSPLDGQPCMDHDRASGEGVGVQEYTGVKLQVLLDDIKAIPLESRDKVKDVPVGKYLTSPEILAALKGKTLYMVAATLRPETMYGQTNCFVGVDLAYGIYQVNATEAWICTERSAKNMSFQGLFGTARGEITKLGSLKGSDLIGVPLKAPLAQYSKVYTLPMEGVLATKGTGVVTSVPSDSPDDYITMQDLIKKSAYYNVQSKWVEPFMPPKPIIQTPNFGNLAAVAAVEKLNIKSQKDKVQLAEAKELVYKEGFYSGVILVGQFKGKPVQEAKPLIKEYLIAQGLAFTYCEPEGQVISRSGDECVVTLADQWYMDYGEESWKKTALECLGKMETFQNETRNAFEKNLDWLGQWACSRSFGLGSRLPWDPTYLIESLSDSTIYMAYYTVAHILHEGTLDGSKPGSGNIAAADMTDAVWDYIMLQGPAPKSKIPKAMLEKMKQEFEFFYPLDLRCSGKDLVTNHLTFFIYNHTAIFPPEKWPLGVRSNGHLLLNSEKMSKSTGNFMTLSEAIQRYGADATRFALADAGDGLEDANFVYKTADDAILKLFTEKEWAEETIKELGTMRTGKLSWNDRVFEAEITRIVAAADKGYTAMLYREALKCAYYDLQNAKSEYRKATIASSDPNLANEKYEGMHKDLILRFIEVQALVMAPIAPHWSEYMWSTILKKATSIQTALWPTHNVPVDTSILKGAEYVRDVVYRIRAAEDAAARKKNKKGGKEAAAPPADAPKTIRLYYASSFPAWQDAALEALKKTWVNGAFTGKEREVLGDLMKDKRVMPFIAMMKKTIETVGASGFDRRLEFQELETLKANADYIRRELVTMKITKVEFVAKEDVATEEDVAKADTAVPGVPTYRLF
ncbi:hypothetical protein BJ741DRAFT_397903 [Chytriomyces cf. hyalinus JEL632]|nr:hypothetical protein BJ741DRAFT_397903 [Chytriomyces cf. hyalinus JEL632]